jgi:hypothetical protein
LWLADKLGEDSNVKAVRKGRKNTIMKISGSVKPQYTMCTLRRYYYMEKGQERLNQKCLHQRTQDGGQN